MAVNDIIKCDLNRWPDHTACLVMCGRPSQYYYTVETFHSGIIVYARCLAHKLPASEKDSRIDEISRDDYVVWKLMND
jgi:hypothetical protein